MRIPAVTCGNLVAAAQSAESCPCHGDRLADGGKYPGLEAESLISCRGQKCEAVQRKIKENPGCLVCCRRHPEEQG